MRRGIMVGLGVAVVTAGALVVSPGARGAGDDSDGKGGHGRFQLGEGDMFPPFPPMPRERALAPEAPEPPMPPRPPDVLRRRERGGDFTFENFGRGGPPRLGIEFDEVSGQYAKFL